MADRLDWAWSALRGYGVRPEDVDDDPPELDQDDLDDTEHAVCVTCGGDAFKIGTLGVYEYYKCRECGDVTTPLVDDDEEGDDDE